jgi:DUSP domain
MKEFQEIFNLGNAFFMHRGA